MAIHNKKNIKKLIKNGSGDIGVKNFVVGSAEVEWRVFFGSSGE
jgi:hypothetical protein